MAKRRAATATEADPTPTAIDTELLGSIPNEWPVVRLREVTYEGTDRNRELAATRDDVLAVDNQNGLTASDRLLGDDFSRYKFVRRGEFAYNPMRLNVGSIGLSDFDKPGLVSPDYIVFGCHSDRLDPDFLDLFRLSDGWKAQIRLSGAGSIRIRYYYRDIAEFVVPLPPLPEQRAIAHVLRAVQRAKEAAEAVVAAARQLKRSLLRHLFTYGPVPVDRADRVLLKDTEIGPIPEHWEAVPLDRYTGHSAVGPRFSGDLYASDGNVATLRTTDFTDEGGINLQTMPLASLDLKKFASHLLQREDFLVSRSGAWAGIASVFQGHDMPVLAGAFIIRFVLSEGLNPHFLREYFNSPLGQPRVAALATGAAQKNITSTALRQLLVPVPPIAEQDDIVRAIVTVERKRLVEESRVSALGEVFRSLLRDLMTGRVRVHELGLGAAGGGA